MKREEELKQEICTCARLYLEDGSHYLNCPVFRFGDLISNPS
jgi:hypothetical protein